MDQAFIRISQHRLSLKSSSIEETKSYDEFTTTAYDKVLKILNTTKLFLEDLKVNPEMVSNLEWVIKKITSETLYTYEATDPRDNLNEKDSEVTNLIEYLTDYSQPKNFENMNKQNTKSKTSLVLGKKKEKKVGFGIKKLNSFENSKIDEKRLLNTKNLADQRVNEETIADKYVGETDFNIFDYEQLVSRKVVYTSIARYVYRRTNSFEYLDMHCLDKFLEITRDRYSEVPYHNSTHGADVMQTIYLIYSRASLSDLLHLNDIDVISLMTSALLHDLGHPGKNNTFQMNTYSDQAITYNDKSVLENYHISESFRIIRTEECNIFSKLEENQYRSLRKRMIEMILSTDMVLHAKLLSLVKNRISSQKSLQRYLIDEDSPTLFEEQQEVMNFILHTADISHSAKSFDVSYKWTYLIMNEFWDQGEEERKMGLKISFLCDRLIADVPKGQIYFIKGIIQPSFEILCGISDNLGFFLQNVENNLNQWNNLIDEKNSALEKEK